MKYALLVFILPVFLHASNDSLVPNKLEQQLLLKQKKELMHCVINPNSEIFDEKFKIFTHQTKMETNTKNNRLLHLNFLQCKTFRNAKALQWFACKNEQPELTEKIILKQLKEQTTATKNKLLIDQNKSKLFKKLRSATSYFVTAGALFGLALLSRDGSLDENDCNYLEPIICESLGLPHLLLLLKPSFKNTVGLFVLGITSTYYGLKDIYAGIFFKNIVEKNLQGAKKIEEIINSYKKKEN